MWCAGGGGGGGGCTELHASAECVVLLKSMLAISVMRTQLERLGTASLHTVYIHISQRASNTRKKHRNAHGHASLRIVGRTLRGDGGGGHRATSKGQAHAPGIWDAT